MLFAQTNTETNDARIWTRRRVFSVWSYVFQVLAPETNANCPARTTTMMEKKKRWENPKTITTYLKSARVAEGSFSEWITLLRKTYSGHMEPACCFRRSKAIYSWTRLSAQRAALWTCRASCRDKCCFF